MTKLILFFALFISVYQPTAALNFKQVKKYSFVPALTGAGLIQGLKNLKKRNRFTEFLKRHEKAAQWTTAGLLACGLGKLMYDALRYHKQTEQLGKQQGLILGDIKKNLAPSLKKNSQSAYQNWYQSIDAVDFLYTKIQRAFDTNPEVILEIDELLKNGVDAFAKTNKNVSFHSPMYEALFNDQIDNKKVLKILDSHGFSQQKWIKSAEPYQELERCCIDLNVDGPPIIKTLLDLGLDPLLITHRDYIKLAIEKSQIKTLGYFEKSGHFVQWIKQYPQKATDALAIFFDRNQIDFARILLQNGVHADADTLSTSTPDNRLTPLSASISVHVIQLLAQHYKIMPQFNTLRTRIKDNQHNFKPLFDKLAFELNDIAAVKLLINNGYKISTRSSSVKDAKENGLDFLVTESDKETDLPPLHRAVKAANLELIQLFIQHGALFEELDADGKLALDYSNEEFYEEIKEKILNKKD